MLPHARRAPALRYTEGVTTIRACLERCHASPSRSSAATTVATGTAVTPQKNPRGKTTPFTGSANSSITGKEQGLHGRHATSKETKEDAGYTSAFLARLTRFVPFPSPPPRHFFILFPRKCYEGRCQGTSKRDCSPEADRGLSLSVLWLQDRHYYTGPAP